VIVLGATGLVGRTIVALLEERRFPVAELRLLATEGGGRAATPRGARIAIEAVRPEVSRAQIWRSSPANDVSTRWSKVARERGVRVWSTTAARFATRGRAAAVPEVNGNRWIPGPWLVANPDCSTIAIALLAPLARRPLERARGDVSVGLGRRRRRAGRASSRACGRTGRRSAARAGGAAPHAFNVVPSHRPLRRQRVHARGDEGGVETRKILGLPDLPVSATAARVPVRWATRPRWWRCSPRP
jgi:aspartate-semialdehyde dehydrogenase